MSTQNRTQARTKAPVSSHPLFPAIVALWFGALFGLGSLAVRPSLLESLVMSSHLDVIVPMTAPPLGMTARILLALAMAAIGIAAGAIIARWIARPRPVAHQRRRNAASEVSKTKPKGFAAPRHAPEPEAEPAAVASGRRRALSVDHDEVQPHADYRLHAAPLPGGAPEIFDVTQLDLTEPEALVAPPVETVAAAQPLELSGFASPEVAPDIALAAHCAQEPATVVETVTLLELDEPAMSKCDGGNAASERQVFGSPLHIDFAAQAPASPVSAARPFDAAPADFAAAAEPALAPESFEASLTAPTSAPVPEMAAMEISAMHNQLRRVLEPAENEAPFAPAPAPQTGLATPHASTAERIASANLAELSPVELIERFALALQQRRHSGAFPDGLAVAAAALAPAEPAQVSEPVAETVTAPFSFAPPAPAAVPETFAAPELPRFPDILDPAPFSGAAAADAAIIPAPSPLALPSALRPIDFSEYEDQDDQQSHVPQRSITMPAAAEAEEAPVTVQSNEAVAAAETEADVPEESYSSLLDLNRPAPLRQTFVRIEEPVAESAAVEPVVIFPGQDARVGMRFARPDESVVPGETQVETPAEPAPVATAASDSGVTPLRRFDPPGAAAPTPAQDPEEAERALRSALATLQRMSGAA